MIANFIFSRLLGNSDLQKPELADLLTEDLLDQAPGAGCTAAHIGGNVNYVVSHGER